jgi:GTP cyclohydrolase I
MKLVKDINKESSNKPQVSDKEAEEAIKKLLAWIGEDPSREGLQETPKRVVKALKSILKDIIKTQRKIYQRLSVTLKVTMIW